MGAEKEAPYEYYFAREHLNQAQIEANRASYSDAAAYAEIAERFASKAVQLANAARRSNKTPMPVEQPDTMPPEAK